MTLSGMSFAINMNRDRSSGLGHEASVSGGMEKMLDRMDHDRTSRAFKHVDQPFDA